MSFETMYESDFYRIEVDLEGGLLRAKWLRAASAEEIKVGGTKLFEVLRDTKVERAVANAQALTSLSVEAKEWMSSTFYGLLSQTGLQKLARVLPEDNVFARIALESVATRSEAQGVTKFMVKNFPNQQQALRWLDE